MSRRRMPPLILLAALLMAAGVLALRRTSATAPALDHDALAQRLDKAFRRAPRPAYTAWLTSRVISMKGALVAARITHAQRPNGDWVERIETPRTSMVTREIRFVEGATVLANDGARAQSTFRGDRTSNLAKLLLGLDPGAGCREPYPEMESRGAALLIEDGEPVAGFATLHIKTAADGAEKWVAPELGCAVLASVRELKDASGQLESRREVTADRVAAGEPDAALFDTAGYAEAKPSEVYRRFLAARNGPVSQEVADGAEWRHYRELDATYRAPK